MSGIGDKPRRERGSTEFLGQGIIATQDGTVLHIRDGAPELRISGSKGEIRFEDGRWQLWQDVDVLSGKGRVEMPWPDPQFLLPNRAVYCLDDLNTFCIVILKNVQPSIEAAELKDGVGGLISTFVPLDEVFGTNRSQL